jgi:hypothetical protein
MVNVFLEKFTGTIYLKKTKFFGLKKYYAEIKITQTLKVISLKTNIKNLPFKIKDRLDITLFKQWVLDNKYHLGFSSKNIKLKRMFYFY